MKIRYPPLIIKISSISLKYSYKGSGKSFLIRGIRILVREYNRRCVVAALTGKAANNISGVTLHSLLFLQTAGDLKGLPLRTIQGTFSNSSFLIIDEYSMVGFRLLAQIDKRLRQATGRISEPFGGVSIILVGDILQLPPVGDKPLYHVASVRFNYTIYSIIVFWGAKRTKNKKKASETS